MHLYPSKVNRASGAGAGVDGEVDIVGEIALDKGIFVTPLGVFLTIDVDPGLKCFTVLVTPSD